MEPMRIDPDLALRLASATAYTVAKDLLHHRGIALRDSEDRDDQAMFKLLLWVASGQEDKYRGTAWAQEAADILRSE